MRIKADSALKKSQTTLFLSTSFLGGWGVGERVMGRGGGGSLFKEGCLLSFPPDMMGA